MNKLTSEFIKSARAFFPIYSYNERKYLNNLALDIDDYCDEQQIKSITELNETYGMPFEIAQSYFSACTSDYVLNKLKLARRIKIGMGTIILAMFLLFSFYCSQLYSDLRDFTDSCVIYEETFIEDN